LRFASKVAKLRLFGLGIPSRNSAQNSEFCASPVKAVSRVQKTHDELQKVPLLGFVIRFIMALSTLPKRSVAFHRTIVRFDTRALIDTQRKPDAADL